MAEMLTDDEVRDFIAAHRWQFAKSMPWIPHYYTLRKFARSDREFALVVQHMREAGYDHRWGKRTFRYFDLDGFHYWTMGNPLDVTKLINRAEIKPARVIPPPPQLTMFVLGLMVGNVL